MRRFLPLFVLLAMLWPLAAHARNPHCAGGIQYVVGALRDKDKGNMEDYRRQLGKAIDQLTICAAEDPKDAEALGYLGWAYAEAESACRAGTAFESAIAALLAKGDQKKADWAANNRDSYYARFFNAGIDRISNAQAAYPDMGKRPEHDADRTLRGEAVKAYAAAEASLSSAACIKPGDGTAYRNLGLVFVFRGDYDRAEEVFRKGLAAAPGDTQLAKSLAQLPAYRANRFLMQADSAFRKAQGAKDEERRSLFTQAGELYGKAAAVRADDADAAFNAGSAYKAAGNCDSAGYYLKRSLALRPEDVDAMSLYADCLAEKGDYRRAVELLHGAVVSRPKEVSLHRQLGSVYVKGGKNDKGDSELFLAVALSRGRPAGNAAEKAKGTAAQFAASQAAKTLAQLGAPEEVLVWEADGTAMETWFYLARKQAHTFARGILISRSDWAVPDLAGLGAAAAGGNK